MMSKERKRYDRVAQHMTRRRAIVGGATLLSAGGSLVWVVRPVSAAVSIDDFTVADKTFEAETVDPVVDVDVAYEFDATGAGVDELAFALTCDGDEIAADSLVTSAESLAETTTLSGHVTDASAWDAADFEPEVAGEVQHTVTLGLAFDVLDASDDRIVGDTAETEATIVVDHPQDSVYTASVGGDGTIRAAE